MRHSLVRLTVASAAVLAPSLAFAHSGHGDPLGFAHGLAHPIGGLDHVLAMVMVGAFAFQLGGRATWLVPATFVGVMVLGGALGMSGFELPLVETGIALSVITLGAVVALGAKWPTALAMALVGAFAVFHGYAHGAEMPDMASGLGYAAGFMLATASLHAVGVGGGYLIGRVGDAGSPWLVRGAGTVAAGAGALMLGGVL